MEVLDLQFGNVKILVSFAVLIGFVEVLVSLYKRLVVKPERLREMLRKQGISGPPPTLLLGNIREIKKAQAQSKIKAPLISTINDDDEPAAAATTTSISHHVDAFLFPFFEQWRKQYGNQIKGHQARQRPQAAAQKATRKQAKQRQNNPHQNREKTHRRQAKHTATEKEKRKSKTTQTDHQPHQDKLHQRSSTRGLEPFLARVSAKEFDDLGLKSTTADSKLSNQLRMS